MGPGCYRLMGATCYLGEEQSQKTMDNVVKQEGQRQDQRVTGKQITNNCCSWKRKMFISSTATVLSDLCGPQEWVPMNKLHEVMFEKYGNLWHHNRVRKYLVSEDWPESETDGRPWHGLSVLLGKYPEHFVINTRKAGGQSTELVSLVSLQP